MHKTASFFLRFKNEFFLLVFSVLGSFLLLANPGVFSHDELQKADHITHYGFLNYLKVYTIFLHDGETLAFPFRPVGFAIQGVTSFFLADFPILTYLIGIFIHATVVLFLYRLCLLIFNDNKRTSLLAAMMFSVSPLVVFSVGWSAASMDRLFVLFVLIGIILFFQKIRSGALKSTPFFLSIILLSFFAILSKETALIIPVLILSALLVFPVNKNKIKNIILLFCISVAQVVFYFLLRFNAFKNTFFGNHDTGSYSISIENIFRNIVAYWSYPFIPFLNEAANITFLSHLLIAIAFFFHVVLLLFIGIKLSFRVAAYYVFFYFLPLAPILLINGIGSQYLYASAISMSIILALLISKVFFVEKNTVYQRFFVAFVILVLGIHALSNQIYIYTVGRCADKAMSSIDSQFRFLGNGDVYITIEAGAKEYILQRIITGRENVLFGSSEKKVIYLDDSDKNNIFRTNHFRFSNTCILYSDK